MMQVIFSLIALSPLKNGGFPDTLIIDQGKKHFATLQKKGLGVYYIF